MYKNKLMNLLVTYGLMVGAMLAMASFLTKDIDTAMDMYWLPGSYTALAHLVQIAVAAGWAFAILVSLVAVSDFSRIPLKRLIVVALVLNMVPSHEVVTRQIGHVAGVAKSTCWFPESYECLKATGGSVTSETPKIWAADKSMTEWGRAQLKELLNY